MFQLRNRTPKTLFDMFSAANHEKMKWSLFIVCLVVNSVHSILDAWRWWWRWWTLLRFLLSYSLYNFFFVCRARLKCLRLHSDAHKFIHLLEIYSLLRLWKRPFILSQFSSLIILSLLLASSSLIYKDISYNLQDVIALIELFWLLAKKEWMRFLFKEFFYFVVLYFTIVLF